MPKVFFISDTHWMHNNIIKLCHRPFSSNQEMTEILIENWNGVVRPEDTVYHLGDFINPRGTHPERFLKALNGNIILLQGNHDSKKCLGRMPSWHPRLYMKTGGYSFMLQHYPEYPVALQDPFYRETGMYRGLTEHPVDFILSGHIHNNHFDRDGKKVGRLWTGRSLNLSVEMHDYKPVALERILEFCRKREDQMSSPEYKLVVPADNPDEQLAK